ncbi:uncharacterized protein LOC144731462 [Lampetra planeri]
MALTAEASTQTTDVPHHAEDAREVSRSQFGTREFKEAATQYDPDDPGQCRASPHGPGGGSPKPDSEGRSTAGECGSRKRKRRPNKLVHRSPGPGQDVVGSPCGEPSRCEEDSSSPCDRPGHSYDEPGRPDQPARSSDEPCRSDEQGHSSDEPCHSSDELGHSIESGHSSDEPSRSNEPSHSSDEISYSNERSHSEEFGRADELSSSNEPSPCNGAGLYEVSVPCNGSGPYDVSGFYNGPSPCDGPLESTSAGQPLSWGPPINPPMIDLQQMMLNSFHLAQVWGYRREVAERLGRHPKVERNGRPPAADRRAPPTAADAASRSDGEGETRLPPQGEKWPRRKGRSEPCEPAPVDRVDVSDRIDDSHCVETADGQRRWQCRLCEKSYTSKYNLVTHVLGHSGVKPHACTQCGKLFKQLSHLNTHRLTHAGARPHRCHVCGRAFTQTSHLKRHLMQHSAVRPYNCGVCGRGFAYPSELRAHQSRHVASAASAAASAASVASSAAASGGDAGPAPGSERRCAACGVAFASAALLRRHKASVHQQHRGRVVRHHHHHGGGGIQHHGQHGAPAETRDGFPCGECGKTFQYRSQLHNHELKHKGERPHICTECGMEFVQSHHLKQHMLIHKGIKEHKCGVCGRGFTLQANMKRHQLTHTNVRAYHCHLCHKAFTQKQTLKAHMIVHSDSKPFHCKICGKQFNRLHNLMGHLHLHASRKPFQCSHCPSKFTLKGNLTRHTKMKHGAPHGSAWDGDDATAPLLPEPPTAWAPRAGGPPLSVTAAPLRRIEPASLEASLRQSAATSSSSAAAASVARAAIQHRVRCRTKANARAGARALSDKLPRGPRVTPQEGGRDGAIVAFWEQVEPFDLSRAGCTGGDPAAAAARVAERPGGTAPEEARAFSEGTETSPVHVKCEEVHCDDRRGLQAISVRDVQLSWDDYKGTVRAAGVACERRGDINGHGCHWLRSQI